MSGATDLQLFEQLVDGANLLFLSDADFVVINGVTRPTLKKIYAEFLASTGTFTTIAAGLAATSGTGTNNRFFTVPDTGEIFEIRYRNDAGVAVEVGKSLSASVDMLGLNAGKNYPLKIAIRNAVTSAAPVLFVNGILDIKVTGVPAGKYARLSYYGNGTNAFGAPNYGMNIDLFDAATYPTASVAVPLTTYLDTNFTDVTSNGVTTRTYLKTRVDGVGISITFRQSVFAPSVGTPVFTDSAGSSGYSWIIDPACYVPDVPLKETALTLNADKSFPLKPATRAGAVSSERVPARSAILDIRVIGMAAGKFARFAYYGNGTTAFGAPDYGMIFEIADVATYGSTGVSTRLTERATAWDEEVVSGTIVTRTYRTTTVEGLLISITYDKAVFAETLGTEVVLNAVGSPGYSWIIDPACYMPMRPPRVLDSLKVNVGVNFPLASYSRAGAVSAAESRLNRAILDPKITGVEDGKLVRLAYVANGTTAFGGGPNYGMIIEIADAATYNTTGVATQLVARTDPWQEVPGEGTLVTRYYRQTTQAQGGMTVAITYDKAVLAEIDGTPIVLNNQAYPAYSWIFDPACYRPAEKPVAAKTKGLLYSATADELTVVWQYSATKLMRIKIGRYGPNLLNDIGEIAEQVSSTLTLSGAWTVLAARFTDWIGPYQVTAVNNGDGGGTVQSTGGNHPINNTTTPTAEQLERSVYADGGLLVTGNGQADEMVIKWANRVMGHNTMTTARRYILREDLMLRIRPGSFEVHGEITALEDIVIGNYFGLQCYDPGHDQTIHFFNGQDNGRVAITPAVAQYSGAPATYPNAWGMSLRGSERNLTLWMDRTYGIAAPGYLPASGLSGLMFHQKDTKKAYHQLLEPNKPLALASGASDCWRGGYIFSPSLSSGADLAQRYYNGGVPGYIVAMTAPGSAKVAAPLADLNHKTALDGAGMTVSGYVPPTGLSVKATGYSVSKVAIA